MTPPPYAALPRPDDGTGLPLAWGAWGPDDQIGTLNRITDATVAAAATEIRQGQRFSLNLPLDEPFGAALSGAHRRRAAPTPTLVVEDGPDKMTRDDKLDGFWLQASSQWDGLNHYACPIHGFYNNAPLSAVIHGEGSRNGIDKALAHGIAGRAILADLPRYFASIGRPWTSLGSLRASAADLMACLAAAGVVPRPGDILLVRTGWLAAFRAAAGAEARDALLRGRDYSGVDGGAATWEWLWDQGIAAIAADSPTVEAFPITALRASLHWGIGRMGFCLGEFFDLEALAGDSAATGRATAFLLAAPLNLRGGVGSPANAMALR